MATYNAFVAPALPYSTACPANVALNNNIRLYHAQNVNTNNNITWNWDVYKQTRPLYTLGICPQSGLRQLQLQHQQQRTDHHCSLLRG